MAPSLLTGAHYLKRGFSIIRSSGIRRFALIPVVVNVLVFAGIIWLGWDLLSGVMPDWLTQSDSWWANTLETILGIIFGMLAILALFFGFTAVANIIAAPFNGPLSEAVERQLSGQGPPEGTFAHIIKTLPTTLWNETGKVFYFALIGILAWLIPIVLTMFIPGVNVLGTWLATALSLLFLAWMHAVEYIDYPMSNREIRFKEVRQRVKRRRTLALGFGAAVMLVMLIPIVNLFAMPAAVAGATALWHDHFRD